MYHLEILLPVCGLPKYLTRLQDFQRFGIVNHRSQSVKVRALIGTEPESLFRDGWKCPIEFVPGEKDHVAQKIYSYYANMTEADAMAANWFMRVDDDSSTNIAGLNDWLEQFDPNEPHYFTTRHCWGLPDYYAEVADSVGYSHLRPPNNKSKNGGFVCHVPHEWECCVVSRAMMLRIIRHEAAMQFLRGCSEIPKGWGDMALSVAARMTGIAVAEVEVLSSLPDVHNFSALGGDIDHIHFVARDLAYWDYFEERMIQAGY